MKRLLFMLIFIAPFMCAQPVEDFQLIIEPKWHNLQPNPSMAKKFGGKWILIGSITFRKKAQEEVNLTKIYLKWKGQPLGDLFGSLYRKSQDKEFLPIQDNLVCDGTWNKTKQTLKLTFEQQHTLGLTNTFYLVMTIPDCLEPILRHGQFEIAHQELPEPFRQSSDPNQLLLSLDAVDITTSEISEMP